MKYYSDVTKKFYNDVKVLEADEAAVVKAEEERKAALVKQQEQQTKLKEQRAARAEEITQAIKERDEAQKKVNELLNKFVKDYGSYHYTWSSELVDDAFKTMFKFF